MSKTHRLLFSVSFIIFLVVATFIGYVAVQNRQSSSSRAAVDCTEGFAPQLVQPTGNEVTQGNFKIDWRCVKTVTGYYITVNKAPFAGSGESLTCGEDGDVCQTLDGKFNTNLSYNFSNPLVKYRIRIYSMIGTEKKTPITEKVVSVKKVEICSPPQCPPGRVLYCPLQNGCPGGCGLACGIPSQLSVTPSPTPTGPPSTPSPTPTEIPDGCTDRPPVILSPQGTAVPKGVFKLDWRCVKTPANGYFITINKSPFAASDGASLTCNQNGDVCKQLDGKFNTKFDYNFNNATVKYRVKVWATKTDGTKLLPAVEKLISVTGGGTTITPSPSTSPQPSVPPTTETPPPGGTVDLNLHLSLSFQGITGHPSNDKMNVYVALVGGGHKYEDKENQFTAGNNGVWTGDAVLNGVEKRNDYYLLVKGPKHIQKRICDFDPTLATETKPGTYSCFEGHILINNTSGSENWELNRIKLLAGDLPNQDGVVDAYDVSLVRNILAKPLAERSNPENVALADINQDGVVDSQDYSLVIAALSIRSDDK